MVDNLTAPETEPTATTQSVLEVDDRPDVAPGWSSLYIMGGAAALIAVVLFRRNLGTELVTFQGFGLLDVPAGHPGSALGWFRLLQSNKLVGLALYDLADVINYGLLSLTFLALYGALRTVSSGGMALATVCALGGTVAYGVSNQAFSMLNLSQRYWAATSETQRAMLESAGEALLSIHNPGTIYQSTGVYAALLLVPLAGLISSIVMLRSSVFGKRTAWVGVVANGVVLGHFVALAFAPALIAIPTAASAPFRVIWHVLVGLRLLRLGRTHGRSEAVSEHRQEKR
jgi:hypothetical protein